VKLIDKLKEAIDKTKSYIIIGEHPDSSLLKNALAWLREESTWLK
jgi:cob(I)alamin adenosyltransferase